MRLKKLRTNLFYKILMAAFTLSIFSEGVIVPIYAIFVQKVGGDVLDAGLAMGVFLMAQGLFAILFHRFVRNEKKRLFYLILGWAVWVIGITSYLIVSSVLMLLLTQVLTALGNAIADPIFDVELADHEDQTIAEFEWGFFEGSTNLVSGFAAIVGGMIVQLWGFKFLIGTMIFTATLSLLIISFYSSLIHKQRKLAAE